MEKQQPSDMETKVREVRFQHSPEFPDLLQQLNVSLLVSTYQAGKLVAIGHHRGELRLSFHNFEQPMGIAIGPDQIAVGSKSQVWFLQSAPEIVSDWAGNEDHDACYLARSAHVTDDIHVHEMVWCGQELWAVNTRFSCLCTLTPPFSFVPRWKPAFISELAAEDRCHLNGLCAINGAPRFVTAMSETNTAGGWRPTKAESGCLIDIASGATVARGFAMPHSPRIHQDQLWLLDSGRGRMVTVDPQRGTTATVTTQPGYTRGLDFAGDYAFIGLSKIRETSTFGGVPIAEQRDSLKCGVAIIHVPTGKQIAHFEFVSAVEEIFDVKVLPTATNPLLVGPKAAAEGVEPLWFVPYSAEIPSRLSRSADTGEHVPVHLDQPSSTVRQDDRARHEFVKGVQHAEQDDVEPAILCFRRALEMAPKFVDAQWNLGVALHFSGQIDDSVTALRQALEWSPDLPAAHLNLAMGLFLQGHFLEAWSEYEWRWKCPRFPRRQRPDLAVSWEGTPLEGRKILIYGEQGIGDEIMFASCYSPILAVADQVVLVAEERLVPLLRRSYPNATVMSHRELEPHPRAEVVEDVDFQVAAGSLGRFVRGELAPADAPGDYLVADPEAQTRWENRLAELGPGKRVGISWRGGSEPGEMRRRSTSLDQWAAVLQTPETHFINLQYGASPEELAYAEELGGRSLHDWPDNDPLKDMDEFAALVRCLDLVISIDNSTVHLAGALGVPTWALLGFPSASYWRWGMNGEKSVWYRPMVLLRREKFGDWSNLFQHVGERLANNFSVSRASRRITLDSPTAD